MPKSVENEQIPVAAQSESQRFDIFAVPDVHSVAQAEEEEWDTVVGYTPEAARKLSPPVPKEE